MLAHLQMAPPPPSTYQPDLPPAVDAVFAQAMAKRPTDRYSTAAELAQALAASFGEQHVADVDDRTEVGVVFPAAALRRDPHTRPTTQVAPAPAEVAAAEVVAAQPPLNRNCAALAPLAALMTMVLIGVLGINLVSFAQGQQRVTATAEIAASDNSVLVPTSTPTSTAEPTVTPTTKPSATATCAPTATSTTQPTVTPTIAPTAVSTTAPSRAPAAAGGVRATPRPAQSRPSPTPKPAPTRTTTPRPVVQPTALPTARPTDVPPVAALPTCPFKLTGGFGNLWRTNDDVRSALKCPAQAELAGYSVEQLFDGGRMYYREEGHRFWIFDGNTSGRWREYEDVYETDPDPTDPPPEGKFAAAGGFGKLWQKYASIRKALGWATTPQQGFTGALQAFEGGLMLFVPGIHDHGKQIYVLNNNGTFQVYADAYVGP